MLFFDEIERFVFYGCKQINNTYLFIQLDLINALRNYLAK